MIVGSPTVLNLVPSGVMPIMHINQTDAGFDKEIIVNNGNIPFLVPVNVSATIRGTKGDGYGITAAVNVTAGTNIMTFTVTEQMTAVAGWKNIYELVFVNTSGLRVSTINFVMAVEPSALGADTVISDSEIAYAEQVIDELGSIAAYGTILDNKIYKFDTVAQMVADTSLEAGMYAQTGGYYAVNDGGSALYRIYSTAPGTYYETLTNGLYARLILDGIANPRQFGAYGDGTYDDTTAIQNALNASHAVFIPDGTYLINGDNAGFGHLTEGGIFPRSNSTLTLSNGAVLKAKTNSTGAYNIINLNAVNNVTIKGGVVRGEKGTHSGSTGEFGFGIRVSECHNILIQNVEVYDCWGDAIYVGSADGLTGTNSQITISECVLHDCRRQGISVVIGHNIIITGCEIYNISGTAPQSGIDIEANDSTIFVTDVRIINCNIHDNASVAIILASNDTARKILISNCTLEKINLAGGYTIRVADTTIIGNTRIAADDSHFSSCFLLGSVGIHGVNPTFTDCVIDDSGYTNTSLIAFGNDNVGRKTCELVTFANCFLKTNTSAQRLFNNDQIKQIKMLGCKILLSGSTLVTNSMPNDLFEMVDCELTFLTHITYILSTGSARSPVINVRGCTIKTVDRSGYFIGSTNGNTSAFMAIILNNRIDYYEKLIYLASGSSGKALFSGNVVKADHPTDVSSSITLTEGNNINTL